MARIAHFAHFDKNHFEQNAWRNNTLICGVDEVGRGCLAGPLVVAAVILPIGQAPSFLKDSKIMSPKLRECATEWIKKECFYALSVSHNRLIDQHNIYQTTLIGMKKALINLLAISPRPAAIVVDAMPVSLENSSYTEIPIYHFVRGESHSSSIAAASILAKVYRDHLMQLYNTIFPGYYLDKHKGYATEKHRQEIATQQATIIHRTTFLTNIVQTAKEINGKQ
jgi:ribonuclease HII